MLKQSFKKNSFNSRFSDIDESILEYFGRYGGSLKQFIRGKPIRFGYKVWCQNFPDGYLYNFSVYEGKKTVQNDQNDQPTAGSKVVWHFESDLPELEEKQFIFIDNFFNSLPLFQGLTEKGIGCLGTLRNNRIKDCPLSNKDNFSSRERGAFEIKCNQWKWYPCTKMERQQRCSSCFKLRFCNAFQRRETMVPFSRKVHYCAPAIHDIRV